MGVSLSAVILRQKRRPSDAVAFHPLTTFHSDRSSSVELTWGVVGGSAGLGGHLATGVGIGGGDAAGTAAGAGCCGICMSGCRGRWNCCACS